MYDLLIFYQKNRIVEYSLPTFKPSYTMRVSSKVIPMKDYRIRDVAKMFDLAPQTIRFYETAGIIKPMKAENGYRVFDALSFKRLINFKYYQSMGFTVRESADIIKDGTLKKMVAC